MSLILSGSDGLSDVDGSAATPAIRGTDANTGIFFPAADTIGFSEGGVEAMRIDSSGNVGIGTNSPQSSLQVSGAMPVSPTGNGVHVGITSSNTCMQFNAGSGNVSLIDFSTSGTDFLGRILYDNTGNSFQFSTNSAERMRIDSSGNLLVGTSDTGTASGVGLKLLSSPTLPAFATVFNTATATSAAYLLYNTNGTNNGFRFYVQANGGIVNYSANNVNVSDERTKTDIQNSGNYLAKICAIPVRTFKYKDQDDDLLTLGVIAQEVESIAPELVNVDGFGETPEDGIPLKAIYQTDLQYALMKCIQEQQALIQSLTARITALETPAVTPPTGTQA